MDDLLKKILGIGSNAVSFAKKKAKDLTDTLLYTKPTPQGRSVADTFNYFKNNADLLNPLSQRSMQQGADAADALAKSQSKPIQFLGNMGGNTIKIGKSGINKMVQGGKALGAGLVQAPVLAATGGKVNIPFYSDPELMKLSGDNFVQRFMRSSAKVLPDVAKGVFGLGQMATTINPVSQGVNAVASSPVKIGRPGLISPDPNINTNDDLARRLAAGYIKGVSGSDEVATNVPSKEMNIAGINFDPAKTAGEMVGFVNNPTWKAIFPATSKLLDLPQTSSKVANFIVGRLMKGGAEGSIQAIANMSDQMTRDQKINELASQVAFGAVSELGTDAAMKGAGSIKGKAERWIRSLLNDYQGATPEVKQEMDNVMKAIGSNQYQTKYKTVTPEPPVMSAGGGEMPKGDSPMVDVGGNKLVRKDYLPKYREYLEKSAQVAPGVFAGIQINKDENGNITGVGFNPNMAGVGVMAAGYLTTAKNKAAIMDVIMKATDEGKMNVDLKNLIETNIKNSIDQLDVNPKEALDNLKGLRAAINQSAFDSSGLNKSDGKFNAKLMDTIRQDPEMGSLVRELESYLPKIDEILQGKADLTPKVEATTDLNAPKTALETPIAPDIPKTDINAEVPQAGQPKTAQEIISEVATPKVEPTLPEGVSKPKRRTAQEIIAQASGQTETPKTPTTDVEKLLGFTKSVKEAPIVAPQTKAKVNGTYTVKPNTKLMGEAKALLESGASIDFKNVADLDQKVAATIQEAINLDKAGKHDAAANLYNNLAEHGKELGRAVQAYSMIDKMSPQAIALSVAAKIKNYNINAMKKIPELTGEQTKLITKLVDQADKLKGREKNIALNKLQQTLNSFIPSSLADKAITVWKAGLLTSLRTHERNLLGNAIMSASEIAKDPVAAVFDQLMSFRTGQRTMTPTLRGLASGAAKGTKAMVDVVRYGFDPEESISKFDIKQITWGNNPVEKFLKGATEAVFRPLSGEDKIFWHAAYARSLYDTAGAAAINAGKQGDGKFIEKLVKNPTDDMLKSALNDANYATFHDKNVLNEVANSIKRVASSPKLKAGAEVGKVVTEVLAPFTGVPSSIVEKTIAYSPIGLIKGAMKAGKVVASNVPELQRQAAQEIGRGVVGSGLFGLGAYLMSQGLMTGQPKDAKEADLWAAQGKMANSVLVGGKWRSVNSIGPQNLVMLAGAKYNEAMGKEGTTVEKAGAYAGGLAKDQLSQTFLAGVQQPLNAITDPARYGKSYIGNQVASVIPNIIKDTAKAGDASQRENNTTTDYITNSLPGLRNNNIEKRDVLGNPMKQEPTGAAAFYDLFNSKTPISNTVTDELGRLNEAGHNVVPSKLQKDQTIQGDKLKLTPEQLNVLEAKTGEELSMQMEALFNSTEYQDLPDSDKADAVTSLISKVRKVVRANVDLGADPTQLAEVKGASTTEGKKYRIINKETGNVSFIDLTAPVKAPTLTGNKELDKKLKSSYVSDLTTRTNNIMKVYEDGQITAEEAETLLNEVKNLKSKAGSGSGMTAKQKLALKNKIESAYDSIASGLGKPPKLSTVKNPKTGKEITFNFKQATPDVSISTPNNKVDVQGLIDTLKKKQTSTKEERDRILNMVKGGGSGSGLKLSASSFRGA